MIEVASLYGLLELRDNATARLQSFDSALGSVSGRLNNFGSSLQNLGGSMTNMGVGITAVMAPFIAAAGGGIAAAASFEVTLAEIQARARLTSEELQRVSAFALQMGADTVFSAQQAADAFLQLLTSGSSVEEAFAQLPHILNAAAAGGVELGRTSDMITDIMAGFGMEVSATEGLVNQLTMASGASSATMSQLMDALAAVGPVAAQFGLDGTAAIATLAQMADYGIKGAEAGTALRSMLLNLNRPTDGVRRALAALGVSLYDSTGATREMRTVLRELAEALSGLPAEQANELAVELAGSYGIVAFNALMASGGIDDMLARMGDSATATEVASARMNTFDGVVNSLKGSIETLGITAMTPFMNDVLKPMAQDLTTLINKVTAFAAANPELTKTIITVGAVITALGIGLTGLGVVITTIGAGIKGIGALVAGLGPVITAIGTGIKVVLAAVATPAGAVIAVITGITAAYLTNFGGVRDFIDGEVRPALESFFSFLQGVWEQIRPGLESMFQWFVETGLPAIRDFIVNQVVPAVRYLVEKMLEIWSIAGPAIESFVTTAGALLLWFYNNVISPMITRVQELISALQQLPVVMSAAQGASSAPGSPLLIGPMVFGALAGAIAGGGGGGVSSPNPLSPFGGARADGGVVLPGRSYLVGERGAEMFMPGERGNIIPNGGGVTIQNLTVNADGLPAREVERAIRRAFEEVLR